MADAEPVPPPSSSRLEKDSRRAAERAARKERERKKEEERATAAREAKRTRAREKSARAEQEAKDSRWGRCKKFQSLLVGLVHVIDTLIGIAFVVYGALLATKFAEPATAAVVATLTYGSILLFAALMGGLGFYTARCKRVGLAISAYIAPFVALFYLVLLILQFDKAMSDAFFAYLTEHADVMYLNG